MYKKIVSATIIALAFSSCSKNEPIINSSFDISNEFQVKTNFFNTSQIKQMSINGLSPISNVGEIYFTHPSRGAQNAVMIDLSEKITGQNIKYQQIKFEADQDITLKDLIDLKKSIILLETLNTNIIQKKIEVLTLRAGFASATKTQNDLMVEKINELEQDIKTLQNNYNEKNEFFINSTNKKNIFIFRWNTKSKNKQNVTAGEMGEILLSQDKEKSGYFIAAGVSIEKLILSPSYITQLEATINTSGYTSWLQGRIGIVTYTLKVDQLVTFASKAEEKIKKLSLSIKDIKNLPLELANLSKIDLGLSALNSSGFSNFYQLQTPIISIKDVSSIKNTSGRKGGITVFSVITEAHSLGKLFKNKIE